MASKMNPGKLGGSSPRISDLVEQLTVAKQEIEEVQAVIVGDRVTTTSGAAYQLQTVNVNAVVVTGSAAANTVTLPAGLMTPGQSIAVVQSGAGRTTITPAAGVTINSVNASVSVPAQWRAVSLLCIAPNAYVALGV
ncbi:hypothetical protein [Azospirillum sp. SYSU D00513]|uniref:hypothetical protein n=1 Tax=Azospirillum sp. SYSU D00513 TaxID=2812561 RepID=UPI001A96807A|nr:hypothetical protein [Azospirillum sp. SYSU D00513]